MILRMLAWTASGGEETGEKSELKSVFLEAVLPHIPRILSQLCVQPSMKTYGCFDREYWNYSSTDVACARKQEAVLTLALLYANQTPGNILYQNPEGLNYIDAALSFWAEVQLPDGSFNDLYPHEHSFVATAFSSYAASETLLLLPDAIQGREAVLRALRHAGDWVLRKRQKPVCNQVCGAIAFLYNMHRLTGDGRYLSDIQRKVAELAALQSEEGWLPEYGGFDVGYSSVAVDYLGKYFARSGDRAALAIARKLCDLLAQFVHPDFSFGGEYGSRSTQYMLPHGFVVFGNEIESAAFLAHAVAQSLLHSRNVVPCSVDDKYLLFNGYTFLQAHLASDAMPSSPPARSPIRTRYFEQSKIYVRETEDFALIVNGEKGGVVYLFDKHEKKTNWDCGVLLLTDSGKRYTTIGLNPDNRVTVEQQGAETKISVTGSLRKSFDNRLTPSRNLLFRGFQITFGRLPWLSFAVKTLLRNMLIMGKKGTNNTFARTITLRDGSLEVVDQVQFSGHVKTLVSLCPLDTIYGESSRYFTPAQLDQAKLILNDPQREGDVYVLRKRFAWSATASAGHIIPSATGPTR